MPRPAAAQVERRHATANGCGDAGEIKLTLDPGTYWSFVARWTATGFAVYSAPRASVGPEKYTLYLYAIAALQGPAR